MKPMLTAIQQADSTAKLLPISETSQEKNIIKDAVHFPTDETSKSYTMLTIKKNKLQGIF